MTLRFEKMRAKKASISKPKAKASARPTAKPQLNTEPKSYTASEYHCHGGASFTQGAESERKRVAAVAASEACQGRERIAMRLLAETDVKASAIIAKLGTLPTDAERDREQQAAERAAGRERNADIWRKAIGRANATRATGPMADAMAQLKSERKEGKASSSATHNNGAMGKAMASLKQERETAR